MDIGHLARLQHRTSANPPGVIEFSVMEDGTMQCVLSKLFDCTPLEQQFKALGDVLQHHAALTQHMGPGEAVHIDLDFYQQQLPLMPTLNGWLLGYPFIYWVTSREAADKACRHLSTTTLRLHQVKLPLSKDFEDRLKSGSITEEFWSMFEAQQLCAFSIPDYLSSEHTEAAVAAMLHATNQQVEACGLWKPATASSKVVGPQPVAL